MNTSAVYFGLYIHSDTGNSQYDWVWMTFTGFGDVDDNYNNEEHYFPHASIKKIVIIPHLPTW